MRLYDLVLSEIYLIFRRMRSIRPLFVPKSATTVSTIKVTTPVHKWRVRAIARMWKLMSTVTRENVATTNKFWPGKTATVAINRFKVAETNENY